MRAERPQAVFSQPCDDPRRYLGAGDYELMAGRLGDALIECEAKRAGLDGWADGVTKAHGAKRRD